MEEAGMPGNGHMLMLELNSKEVALSTSAIGSRNNID